MLGVNPISVPGARPISDLTFEVARALRPCED
jgi:hypothetical protein